MQIIAETRASTRCARIRQTTLQNGDKRIEWKAPSGLKLVCTYRHGKLINAYVPVGKSETQANERIHNRDRRPSAD